ncbi:sulfatase-like hydrolase/transferase [Paenibacillus sp. IB182496]|uniref:Sulfatase-like hydrolase/transferase n=1 Tax=Paenibacillus sabuli TaxID=2772509 RepID=A0A927BXC8_9BACL|nr:sulfatase-like hydrolase/transferase [Paenibacillus sabuli]MBD2848092.1 sulfatase-like hydrolase/transferase [Paenibacillus sabuli]
MHDTSKKPNVLWITIDECKASALSCYGNEHAITPHLDRLAGEGALFTQAFTVMPKCVPARCSMMTGRYAHVEGHRTLPGFELRHNEPHLFAEMKQRGYRTAMFGKNHTLEEDQQDRWLDARTREAAGKAVRKTPVDGEDPVLFRAMYRKELYESKEMSDTFAAEEACGFMEEHREHPFFVQVNFNQPHPAYVNIDPYIEQIRKLGLPLPNKENIDQAPEVLARYRTVYDLEGMGEEQWRCIVEAYASMVAYADDCVGTLVEAVDRLGLREETIVLFTSDHGDFAGEHGCVEKWDTLFYDCLTHIPFILRYPGIIAPGERFDVLTENIDFMPTVMELLGADIPAYVQGQSLMRVLQGEVREHKEAVFSEGGVERKALARTTPYTDAFYQKLPQYSWKQQVMVEYPQTMDRAKMIRTRRWKMVFRWPGVKELYDLKQDPGELHNVADRPEHQEILRQLTERLLIWALETEPDRPVIQDMRA